MKHFGLGGRISRRFAKMTSTPKTLKRDDEIVFAKGTNFTPLMVQYRAAFGIFASEGFTDSTRNGRTLWRS